MEYNNYHLLSHPVTTLRLVYDNNDKKKLLTKRKVSCNLRCSSKSLVFSLSLLISYNCLQYNLIRNFCKTFWLVYLRLLFVGRVSVDL